MSTMEKTQRRQLRVQRRTVRAEASPSSPFSPSAQRTSTDSRTPSPVPSPRGINPSAVSRVSSKSVSSPRRSTVALRYCYICRGLITEKQCIKVGHRRIHLRCFCCDVCEVSLVSAPDFHFHARSSETSSGSRPALAATFSSTSLASDQKSAFQRSQSPPSQGGPLDASEEQLLCNKDYLRLYGKICRTCQEPFRGKQQVIKACGSYYHVDHFICAQNGCEKAFESGQYFEIANNPYCEEHYKLLTASLCAACDQPVSEKKVRLGGALYHMACVRCCRCMRPLSTSDRLCVNGDQIYCAEDYAYLFGKRCTLCGASDPPPRVTAKQDAQQEHKELYHGSCVKCQVCDVSLKAYICVAGVLRCTEHENTKLVDPICDVCRKPMDVADCYGFSAQQIAKVGVAEENVLIRSLGTRVHPECFRCQLCETPLNHTSARLLCSTTASVPVAGGPSGLAFANKLCCSSCLESRPTPWETERSAAAAAVAIPHVGSGRLGARSMSEDQAPDSISHRSSSRRSRDGQTPSPVTSPVLITSADNDHVRDRHGSSGGRSLRLSAHRALVTSSLDDGHLERISPRAVSPSHSPRRATSPFRLQVVDENRTQEVDSSSGAGVVEAPSSKIAPSTAVSAVDIPASHASSDPLPTSPSATSPTQMKPLGAHQRGDLLGKGGFGRVYRAIELETARQFAIKEIELGPSVSAAVAAAAEEATRQNGQVAAVGGDTVLGAHDIAHRVVAAELSAAVSAQLAGSEEKQVDAVVKSARKLKDFEHEVQLMQRLSHPNIVQYLGFAYVPIGAEGPNVPDSPRVRLFLELCTDSLVNSIQRFGGSLQEPIIRKYTEEMLQGLAYLHKHNIVHRDIKGANILFGMDGHLKLADFGIARPIDTLTESRAKSIVGTPFWMAPEVMRETGYGVKADIWSVGCVIVEMLTGKHPFPRLTQFAAIYRISQGKCPKYPAVSASLDDFLKRCFEPEPEKRPSATQLLQHDFIRRSGT